MAEICFRYSAASVAVDVVEDLRRLHPIASAAHPGEDASVVHVPALLWQRALVPEITLGLGGRLTRCLPSARDDARCELDPTRPSGATTGEAGP
jgi:hypothetical protein